MGFLLPIGDLITDNDSNIPCAMIYGVATLPEYRGFGCGGAISNALIELANKIGYPTVVLCPANDGLFDFYAKKTQMREWFYISEQTLTAPFEKTYLKSIEISVSEYLRLRISLLKNISSIEYNHQVLEYQKKICQLYGGGLYKFELSNGVAIAVVERQSDELICIKELLMPWELLIPLDEQNYNLQEYIINICSAIYAKYPAKEYIIRTPELIGNVNKNDEIVTNLNKRFAMLSLSVNTKVTENTTVALPWYGLAYD
jgi:hypothetical protein